MKIKTSRDYKNYQSVYCIPDENDLFTNEFEGIVVGFRHEFNIVRVEDGDGNVFDVCPYQIQQYDVDN